MTRNLEEKQEIVVLTSVKLNVEYSHFRGVRMKPVVFSPLPRKSWTVGLSNLLSFNYIQTYFKFLSNLNL